MEDVKVPEPLVGMYDEVTVVARSEEEGGWFIQVKEMPGCMSQGDTFSEAMGMIQDAMVGWLEVQHGNP